MLNAAAHLVPLNRAERKPIRDGYGDGLVAAGADERVIVITADLSESTRCDAFAKAFPERFIQVGVAEQNMATIAAGLGVSGKIPFISSYAVFSPGRNWEQIRTTVAYNDSNVKIAGHHAGVSTGPDGATHQALEDVALMRALPGMKVIAPCDAIEAKKATIAAAHLWGPVYLRFVRPATPVVTTAHTPFAPGKAELFWTSRKPQVALFASGRLVYDTLVAAHELEKKGIQTLVYNVHTIKPLDERTVLRAAARTGAVVTVEEHSIIGGLGSAIAELLSATTPLPLERVGSRDVFGESGEPEELLKKYGMGIEDIKKAVGKVMKRK